MALGRRAKTPPARPRPGGAAAAGAAKPNGPTRRERASQLRQAFSLTRGSDPLLVAWVAGGVAVPFGILVVLGVVVGHPVYLGLLGLLVGLVAGTAVFSRRMQRVAYAQVEGQLGAAAAVLSNMRGSWRVTPAVAFTREQDLLHRAIGRPGIVLVGEGSASRCRGLMATEKKQLARTVDVPIYEVVIGDGEGLVALAALQRHVTKLPHNIKPVRVNELDRQLKAMRPARPPIPHGAMPRGGRVPRGKMR